jgi:hypothetical protein
MGIHGFAETQKTEQFTGTKYRQQEERLETMPGPVPLFRTGPGREQRDFGGDYPFIVG